MHAVRRHVGALPRDMLFVQPARPAAPVRPAAHHKAGRRPRRAGWGLLLLLLLGLLGWLWLLLSSSSEEELLVLPHRLHLLPARVHDAEEEGVHLWIWGNMII